MYHVLKSKGLPIALLLLLRKCKSGLALTPSRLDWCPPICNVQFTPLRLWLECTSISSQALTFVECDVCSLSPK